MKELLEMYGYSEQDSKIYMQDGNHRIKASSGDSYLEMLTQGTDSGGLYENGYLGASIGA